MEEGRSLEVWLQTTYQVWSALHGLQVLTGFIEPRSPEEWASNRGCIKKRKVAKCLLVPPHVRQQKVSARLPQGLLLYTAGTYHLGILLEIDQ